MTRSVIEVDLDRITHNVRTLRATLGPDVGLCAVLKADAYALGAPRIAKRVGAVKDGATMLGVYSLDEAREIVNAATGLPILVFSPVRELRRDDRLFRFAGTGQLHLTAHDPEQLEAVARVADALGITIPVHVELDTGMARGGSAPEDALRMLERAHNHRRLRVAGLFSHLASAESDAVATDRQRRTLDEFVRSAQQFLPEDCLIHLANTHGLFRGREMHKSMCRVGIGLFGYADRAHDDSGFPLAREAQALKPAFRWASNVTHVRTVPPGTTVGYGSTWTARRTSRLGLVPVGYADGYPTALSNRARVGVVLPQPDASELRAFAPVVGAISMDQTVIDLTDISDAGLHARVELIGDDPEAPNALPQLARLANTVPYDLMCRLNARIERRYTMPKIATRPLVRPIDTLERAG